MQCGLLGKTLSHSFSPEIHKHLGNYPYALYEVMPEDLGNFLNSTPFTGINVTMPYKKDVIPYCAELSPVAELLGAVNTIVRRSDGSLVGHNTDYFGFRSMVERSGLHIAGKKVLVLGSGGASVTVVAVLRELGANTVVISRNGESNYENLYLHKDASVIVNTTPVGMYPNVGISPIDLNQFPSLEGVLDVVYNPHRTQLLMHAEKRGLVTQNGLWMLVAQAKESAEWFTGCKISDFVIAEVYEELRANTENIILIGMPGCGKSTIGKLLAERTGKRFIDADKIIEENAGISIPEIFKSFGEPHFRKLETEALAQIGKQSGLVIATGGGCVTVENNYAPLHQNGRIVWLQRDIHALPVDGRPLSQSGQLEAMYTKRAPMYQSFADMIADNNGNPEDTVEQILPPLEKGEIS